MWTVAFAALSVALCAAVAVVIRLPRRSAPPAPALASASSSPLAAPTTAATSTPGPSATEAYEKGRGGTTKDKAHAVALYKQACDAGAARACYRLGYLYDGSGADGVPWDEPLAVALYKQACDGGADDACVALGVKYEEGQEGHGGLSGDYEGRGARGRPLQAGV